MEDQELPEQALDPIVYPPKFQKPAEARTNVWVRSVTSLVVYLVLGFYIFRSFNMLLLITGIVLIHEMGHFLAMKAFRYKDLGIFFIPLLGAYVSGSKREVSQRESAVILLAGPVPGILFGILGYLYYQQVDSYHELGGISLYTISVSFILLNLVNLLPIYPLDGGQLLNRVFLEEDGWLSRLFVLLSVAAMICFALFGLGKPFYPLLFFPVMMIVRYFGDVRMTAVEKKIGTRGFQLDKSYEDLSDAEYWSIRNFLIAEHPGFHDFQPSPPFAYDQREEKMMSTIQSLLHRNLIRDISWPGKILVLLIWLTGLASPWLIRMDLSFFSRMGF